jgi:hypothetical protein
LYVSIQLVQVSFSKCSSWIHLCHCVVMTCPSGLLQLLFHMGGFVGLLCCFLAVVIDLYCN